MTIYLNSKEIDPDNVEIILMFRHPNDRRLYPDDFIEGDSATCGSNDLERLKIEIRIPEGIVSFDSVELMNEMWLREHIMKRCPDCMQMYRRTEST